MLNRSICALTTHVTSSTMKRLVTVVWMILGFNQPVEAETLAEIARGHVPRLLKGAARRFAPEWRALRPGVLAEALANLSVQVKTAHGGDGRFAWGCCPLTTMAASELFVRGRTNDTNYKYFSMLFDKFPITTREALLESTSPNSRAFYWELPRDVVARDLFRAEDMAVHRKSLWVSTRGCVTTMHLDEVANFFVSAQGSKRFSVLPPSHWIALGMFPKFHVRHRNVQSPQASPESRLVFDVEEGDVLFMPALWFHEVETTSELAASISNWSPDPEIELAHDAWRVDFPLDPDWPPARLVRSAARFAERVTVATLGSDVEARRFIGDLIRTRYVPLLRASPNAGESLVFAGVADLHPDSLERHQVQLTRERVENEAPPHVSGFGAADALRVCNEVVDVDADADIERTALHAARLLGRVSASRSGEREIILGHFLEDLLSQVVGERAVASVLAACVLREDGGVHAFLAQERAEL